MGSLHANRTVYLIWQISYGHICHLITPKTSMIASSYKRNQRASAWQASLLLETMPELRELVIAFGNSRKRGQTPF
jgi:hypothetical protein